MILTWVLICARLGLLLGSSWLRVTSVSLRSTCDISKKPSAISSTSWKIIIHHEVQCCRAEVLTGGVTRSQQVLMTIIRYPRANLTTQGDIHEAVMADTVYISASWDWVPHATTAKQATTSKHSCQLCIHGHKGMTDAQAPSMESNANVDLPHCRNPVSKL